MNIKRIIKSLGAYNSESVQNRLAILLLIMGIGLLMLSLGYPLMRYHTALSERLQQAERQRLMHHTLLSQENHWRSRYDAIKQDIAKASVHCAWQIGDKTDSLEVDMDEVEACLNAWMKEHQKTISEITLYRKNNVKILEVAHD